MDDVPEQLLERIAAKARWLRCAAKRLIGKAARIDAEIAAREAREPKCSEDDRPPEI